MAELGTAPVLVQCWCVFLGAHLYSFKGRRMWDTPPVASGESSPVGRKVMLSSKGRVDGWLSDAACWFSSVISGVSVGVRARREGKEREESMPACVLLRVLPAGLRCTSNPSHCGRRKQNWFLLPDGSCLTRPTEH